MRLIFLSRLSAILPPDTLIGEAEYIDDIPVRGDELHGVFVVSTTANCQLESIDASEALVIIFIQH